MQIFSFNCPHCSVPLRLKNRMLAGRKLDCPECNRPMQIVQEGKQQFHARKVKPDQPSQPTQSRLKKSLAQKKAALSQPLARGLEFLKSPLGVAWTTAGGFTLLLVTLLLSSETDPEPPPNSASASQAKPTAQSERTTEAEQKSEEKHNKQTPQAITRSRLKNLGNWLQDYQKEHEHFPAGTRSAEKLSPTDRWSWLNTYVAQKSGRQHPQQNNQPWHDALNEDYIRQALPELQNPNIENLTGTNGYPATHFVGMAGVGEDAPQLPVDHPRAGIFAYDRQTRLEDIQDGTSQTILLAGVQEKLGSWASGGPATVRAFTQEPYVNGPDGFGTGQTDSMLVLMADGSVRTLSHKTDPKIIRRMAAMADGLPLNTNIEGEPGQPSSVSPDDSPQKLAQNDSEKNRPPKPQNQTEKQQPEKKQDEKKDGKPRRPDNNRPPDKSVAAVAPPVPQVDIQASLDQTVLSFQQNEPAPLIHLLVQIEETIGVPLYYQGKELREVQAPLQKDITLSLKDTTVREILDTLAQKAGLQYEIQIDAVRLEPAAPQKAENRQSNDKDRTASSEK